MPTKFHFVSCTILPVPPSAWNNSGLTANAFFNTWFLCGQCLLILPNLKLFEGKTIFSWDQSLCFHVPNWVNFSGFFSATCKLGGCHLNKAEFLPWKNFPWSGENYNAIPPRSWRQGTSLSPGDKTSGGWWEECVGSDLWQMSRLGRWIGWTISGNREVWESMAHSGPETQSSWFWLEHALDAVVCRQMRGHMCLWFCESPHFWGLYIDQSHFHLLLLLGIWVCGT